jgi:hypothetical protein
VINEDVPLGRVGATAAVMLLAVLLAEVEASARELLLAVLLAEVEPIMQD